MDLISVIMPVFNGEKYLEQSIESIINQSYNNLELIIINDGSTDNSLNIINKFDDKRIKVLTQPNAGPLTARKKGIEISSGDFIAIMDADDVSFRYRFQDQLEYLHKNPDIHFVGSNFVIIDSEGRKIYRSKVTLNYESIKKLIFLGSPFCHSTMLFRREVFLKYNYENEIPLAEDFNLWFNLLREYRGENLSSHLLLYRIHDQNISKVRNESLFKSIKTVLEREFKHITLRDDFDFTTHYNFFWSPLSTSYSSSEVKNFLTWANSLVNILKLERPRETQIIQYYFFLRCLYSKHFFSSLYLFLKSGYFNPIYFRYGFFYDNLLYRFKKLW